MVGAKHFTVGWWISQSMVRAKMLEGDRTEEGRW